MKDQGATVVINHQIKDGKQNQYEKWLDEIGSICRSYVGNIDWQIIRPIPNLTYDYTVIIRFDTTENLTIWMKSKDREYLIEKARPLFSKDDHYQIKSGWIFVSVITVIRKKILFVGNNIWLPGLRFIRYPFLFHYLYYPF